MSFFDSIGSKVSATGQAAAEKAKNITEIGRLNGVISDHEKRISRLYFEIGQSYYERHRDDPAAEELERIAAVNDALDKIDVCREQIKTLKGVEKCPTCGADVARGSQFCNNCGTKMPPASIRTAPKAQVGRCPTCGAPIAEGNVFCNSCGTKIPENAAAQVVRSKTCPTCGTVLDADAAFCFACGAKLGFEPAPEVKPEAPVFTEPVYEEPVEPEVPAAPEGKVCPKCGAMLDADAMFCFNCGAKLGFEPAPEVKPEVPEAPVFTEPVYTSPVEPEMPAAPEGKLCPRCGEMLDKDAVFCYACGVKLENAELAYGQPEVPEAPVFTEPVYEEPVEPEVPAAPEGKVCPKCGAMLDADAMFCFNCGASLAAPEPEPPEVEFVFKNKTCPMCGTELDADAMFCYSCGTKVE